MWHRTRMSVASQRDDLGDVCRTRKSQSIESLILPPPFPLPEAILKSYSSLTTRRKAQFFFSRDRRICAQWSLEKTRFRQPQMDRKGMTVRAKNPSRHVTVVEIRRIVEQGDSSKSSIRINSSHSGGWERKGTTRKGNDARERKE